MTLKKNTPPPLPTYEFIEDPINDIYHVCITSGEFAGVVFRYDEVKFIPNVNGVVCKFTWNFVRNVNNLPTDVVQPTITVILDDILAKENDGQN